MKKSRESKKASRRMTSLKTGNETETAGTTGDRDFSGKLLSASFTLLGLTVGFYGIIYTAIGDAGPSRSARSEVLPFLVFTTAVVVLNCLLALLAVLDLSGILRARLAMIWATCLMLLLISAFVVARSVMLFT